MCAFYWSTHLINRLVGSLVDSFIQWMSDRLGGWLTRGLVVAGKLLERSQKIAYNLHKLSSKSDGPVKPGHRVSITHLYLSLSLSVQWLCWSVSVCCIMATRVRAWTHTQAHNRLTAFVQDYPGWPVPEETFPSHTHPDHRTSFINFCQLIHNIRPLCSVYLLHSPLWQPISRSALVFLLVLDPLLHSLCISSPNHAWSRCFHLWCVTCENSWTKYKNSIFRSYWILSMLRRNLSTHFAKICPYF